MKYEFVKYALKKKKITLILLILILTKILTILILSLITKCPQSVRQWWTCLVVSSKVQMQWQFKPPQERSLFQPGLVFSPSFLALFLMIAFQRCQRSRRCECAHKNIQRASPKNSCIYDLIKSTIARQKESESEISLIPHTKESKDRQKEGEREQVRLGDRLFEFKRCA